MARQTFGVAAERRTLKKHFQSYRPCCRCEHVRGTLRRAQQVLRIGQGLHAIYRRAFVSRRPWSGRMQATAIALLLLVLPIGASTGNAGAPASGAHVYLLRGVLNIFSLGLDDIAAKLQQQGINVTVANYPLGIARGRSRGGIQERPDEDHHSGWPLFRCDGAALYGGAPGLPWRPR